MFLKYALIAILSKGSFKQYRESPTREKDYFILLQCCFIHVVGYLQSIMREGGKASKIVKSICLV